MDIDDRMDGIHYNAIVMAPNRNCDESQYTLIFDTSDAAIYAQAFIVASEFTDVYNFTL